jgi:hypothetical protein
MEEIKVKKTRVKKEKVIDLSQDLSQENSQEGQEKPQLKKITKEELKRRDLLIKMHSILDQLAKLENIE